MNSPKKMTFTAEEEKAFWIESLISDFEEGVADPKDIEDLRALLLHDPKARQIYRESNQLTTLLESTSTVRSKAALAIPSPS